MIKTLYWSTRCNLIVACSTAHLLSNASRLTFLTCSWRVVAPDLRDPARLATWFLISFAEGLGILTNLLGFPFLLSSLDMAETYPILTGRVVTNTPAFCCWDCLLMSLLSWVRSLFRAWSASWVRRMTHQVHGLSLVNYKGKRVHRHKRANSNCHSLCDAGAIDAGEAVTRIAVAW